MLFYLCGIVLTAAVLMGGGTHTGFLGDVALQLVAIPLLCAALWQALYPESPHWKGARLALWLCGIAVLVTTIQLFPLGFDYWSGRSGLLPKGGGVLQSLQGTHTLSIAPEATWTAALSVIVPLSIFAGTVQLRLDERLRLFFLLACLGATSLVFGFLQVIQGPASPLRLYEFTNPSEAVGFFANRNHFAALLYVTLVLAAIWFWTAADAALGTPGRRMLEDRRLLWLAAAGAFFVAVAAGLAMARSRAGIGLATLALCGIVAMAFKQGQANGTGHGRKRASRASLAAVLFALVFALQFGFGTMLVRFEADPLEDARPALAWTTLKTAFESLPFGTGLGSFVHVYSTVERKEDAGAGFANRAHNDAAELLLETGVLGATLLAAFLIWYVRSTYRAWTPPRADSPSLAPMLERAASLIIGLLLLHSLVDYPLRTAALGSIFAFSCALLAVPAIEPSRLDSGGETSRRKTHRRASPSPALGWSSGEPWPGNWQKSND